MGQFCPRICTFNLLWLIGYVEIFVVIAAEWTYNFKSENTSETQIAELCSIISPHVLHKYANRTIYETHLAILTNIESAMLSLNTEREEDMQHDT